MTRFLCRLGLISVAWQMIYYTWFLVASITWELRQDITGPIPSGW